MREPDQLPPGEHDETGRRIACLPAAVLGNGSLLVTLSSRGEVERLFWPHVDGPQHLGELRLAIRQGDGTRRLDEAPFGWEQRYVDETSIVRTVVSDGAEEIELSDLVDPDAPVLVRRVRGSGSLVVDCRPKPDWSEQATASFVEPETGALVFYGRRSAIALLSPGATGEVRSLSPVADPDGDALAHQPPVLGTLEGGTELFLAFGRSPGEAVEQARAAAAEGATAVERRRRAHDAAVGAGAAPPAASAALYRRSLLVLDLLTDRTTGGVIAAPELDPSFLRSGGYGFVWPRDLAYVALALLAAGRAGAAAGALRWLARTQAPEGLWLQRHWTDGALAPSWGLHQLDETGVALFAYEAAWRELENAELDADLWPSARAGAVFLAGFVDDETGLQLPTIDLWETRQGQHAYSAAAAVGGLRAAASMAARHEPSLEERFRGAAAGIATAIEQHLWSDTEGRYLRSRLLGRPDAGGEPLPAQFEPRLPYPNRIVRSVDPVDGRLDAALLGLAWPFAAVDPGSSRMRATVDAVERALTSPCGGLRRHEMDTYAGGNVWLLCTLWLGLYRRQVGDEGGLARAIDYVGSRATPLGLLPEQVHPDGSPAWVLPLAWSHAMLVLASRPELAIVSAP